MAALTWSSSGNLSAPRSNAAAVLDGDTIYLLGGSTAASTNVDYLPPNSNVWQTGSPLDIARVGLGAELLPSGKILAYGGTSPQAVDAALLYDTTIGDLNDTQDGAIMHRARAFFGFASDADLA